VNGADAHPTLLDSGAEVRSAGRLQYAARSPLNVLRPMAIMAANGARGTSARPACARGGLR
jgi:hypothetical protein